MALSRRVSLPYGWAESSAPLVRVGNRMVHSAIEVHYESVDGQPALDLRVEVINGVPQCREVRFTSHPAGREVRQVDLKAVNLALWVEETVTAFALKIMDEKPGHLLLAPHTNEADLAAAIGDIQRARRGRGARKVNRAYLERVAETYRSHVDGTPTKAVGEAFGVSYSMAAKLVRMARDEGLLGKTTPGRKGA